jgi:hypothetical protein
VMALEVHVNPLRVAGYDVFLQHSNAIKLGESVRARLRYFAIC